VGAGAKRPESDLYRTMEDTRILPGCGGSRCAILEWIRLARGIYIMIGPCWAHVSNNRVGESPRMSVSTCTWSSPGSNRARRGVGTGIAAGLITADHSAELTRAARRAGVPLLHKPLRPAALRALLSAFKLRLTSGSAAETGNTQTGSSGHSISSAGGLISLGSSSKRPASSTAWVRLAAPSLRRMAVMCAFTVASVICSS
jgi:hypothetical protein